MLFNSIEFLLFLPIVFLLYWFVFNKNLKSQNLLILVSSYVFYGWWDYRFLSLIFLSTIGDYIFRLNILKHNGDKKQKLIGLIAGLVFLAVSLFWIDYTGYWITIWDVSFSGPVWVSIGFLIGLLFSTKKHSENKF